MQRTLTASQLCSVNPSSFCLTLFNCEHHFSALLRPSLLFSILTALFNSSQSLFHLFPPQLNSFHLFPTLLNDSHLCPPFLNSSHLLPPLLNSSHLFSPALNSSHLFLSSSQPFSPLVNSSQLLRTEAFSQRSFYTQKLFHTASSYTEKLYTEQAFTQSKLFHRASFCTERLLHTEAFAHSKLLHREAATQDAPKWTKKSAAKAPFATLMQLLQYDLRFSAAKHKSIPRAAAAARNLDAAIPLRSANTELQIQTEWRTTATEMAAPKPDLDAQTEKTRSWSAF